MGKKDKNRITVVFLKFGNKAALVQVGYKMKVPTYSSK